MSRGRATRGDLEVFRKTVYEHYRRYGRSLPWRRSRDPYRILVSEIMLQQTQVARVLPKYEEFVSVFPDVHTLARAGLARVLEVWQGLGYNRRAVALKRIAMRLVDEFDGKIPDDPQVLATFPGIGPATAASIVAFAFNKPVIFLETNIRTAFIHHFFPRATTVSDEELVPLVKRSLEGQEPRRWYNALMDYGAALKKTHGNASRKSPAYRRQGPFKGSNRQARGMILRAMTAAAHPVPARNLAEMLDMDEDRVRSLLAQLEREGFLRRSAWVFTLA